jgi:hypothetical protein
MINMPIESEYPKDLLDEAEKLKPSNEPSFWAKKGCKECYGRGVIGSMTTVMKGNNRIQQTLVCSCVRKRYRVWLRETIEGLKKLKSDLSAENHS